MQFRADFFNLPNHPNFANPFLPAFFADAGVRRLSGHQRPRSGRHYAHAGPNERLSHHRYR
jgi:hypothetical protein